MLKASDIFSNTQQGLGVFEYYLPGVSRKLSKSILSPLREEKHPSFNVFLDDKTGIYFFKDFGTDISGDALEFVKQMEEIDDFQQVLQFINEQIVGAMSSLNPSPRQTTKKKDKTAQTEKEKNNETTYTIGFSDKIDLDFWNQFQIEIETLKMYDVSQVEFYSKVLNGQTKKRDFKNERCFAYRVNDGVKLYMPNSKPKFLHCNKPEEDYVFGYTQLPETGNRVFLTGGEKDVMTLSSLGESAICFNSETCHPGKELIIELKERFISVIVLYDDDETGRRYAKKLCAEYELINANLGHDFFGKDISDYRKEGLTRPQFKELIGSEIEKHYQSVLNKLRPFRFDINKVVTRPTPIIKHGDNSILSVGNITAILGKVKTGKSAFTYEVLTKAFRSNSNEVDMSAFGYSIEPIEKDSVILHFETEQSEYDWHKRLKYVVTGDVDPNRFISYSLTKFAPKERLSHILNIAYYHLTKGVKIHLLAIDGIADLVDSVNDEAECNILVHKVHSIATTYKIPVLVVLHLNPDGSKSRGHLGSQLDRKAESVLIVEREKDAPFSCIKARYTRNADMFQMPIETFQWDDSKKRHVYTGELGEEQKSVKESEMLIDFVLDVFSEDLMVMKKSDFMLRLAEYFKLQKSRAYDYLKKLRALDFIVEENKQIKISDSIKGQL